MRAGTRLPAAYACINAFALGGHPAIRTGSVRRCGMQRFAIAIDGVHVGPSDRTMVSSSGGTGSCPAGSLARYGSVDGLLRVYIVEPGGTRRQCGFRFVLQDGWAQRERHSNPSRRPRPAPGS